MAPSDPRISLDPALHKLVCAAAFARNITPREFVEYAIRNTVFSAEATRQLLEIAGSANAYLPELIGKVDGISDFITDRYVFDLASQHEA